MNQPLIASGDLIADSWSSYRRRLSVYGEFAVWFAALAAIRWAINSVTGALLEERVFRYALGMIFNLPVYFLHAVLGVAIITTVARDLAGRAILTREALYEGFHHVIPAIVTWIAGGALLTLGIMMALGGILTPPAGLPFVVPGLILIIPGTWLAVRWFFAAYSVVVESQGVGTALAASARLVSDRWWQVFGRIVFPWFFFFLAVMLVERLSFLVVGTVIGDPGLLFAPTVAGQDLPKTYTLLKALIIETVDGASLPLFAAAGILLWNDLKKRS